MGNLPARCDQSVAARQDTCQRVCTICVNDDTASLQKTLCSWTEDEHLQSKPVAVTIYDCPKTNGFPLSSMGCHACPPLYDPGSLVPLRGGDCKCADEQRVHQYYRLDDAPFGRGSYGDVLEATHISTGARRAVKAVGKANLKRYVHNVSGFVRREVDIQRRLDHPNIVRLYEAFEDEDAVYLVMELCEGGDLLERVAVERARLPEKEAARLFLQMLASLQHIYLHGVIHRDVKPENFLFVRRELDREPFPPERSPIKLIDFGLSRRISSEIGTRITPKIGTTEYMAPEALAGLVNAALADRMDMWSLGVVLHVFFVGHFPSPRLAEQTPEKYLSGSHWSSVSSAARDLLGQLLRRDPSRRPTVTVALKHDWFNLALATQKLSMMHPMPAAVQSFAISPGLKKIALAAAAREIDDSDLTCVRALYHSLELECDGALTKPALERAARVASLVGNTAAALAGAFDSVDMDGSGAIEWTEFVAASLGVVGRLVSRKEGCDTPLSETDIAISHGMPSLQQEACWRAFDILSQSSCLVSGESLGRLFSPTELSSVSSTAECGTVTSHDTPDTSRLAALDKLVREVDSNGAIDRQAFMNMMHAQMP